MKHWKFSHGLFVFIMIFIGSYDVGIHPLQASAPEGEKLFNQKCSTCHPISNPTGRNFAERGKKNTISLSGAGSKFQPEWLEAWLQGPIRLRPAGTMFLNHIKKGEKFDEVDESTLEPHLSVSAEEAKVLTAYLLTLKTSQVTEGAIQLKEKTPRSLLSKGKNMFEKKKACYGCHQVKTRAGRIVGGASAPTLYNVGNRLQADWVYAYLMNPQVLDPSVWMPKELDEKETKLLTQYLMNFKD